MSELVFSTLSLGSLSRNILLEMAVAPGYIFSATGRLTIVSWAFFLSNKWIISDVDNSIFSTRSEHFLETIFMDFFIYQAIETSL